MDTRTGPFCEPAYVAVTRTATSEAGVDVSAPVPVSLLPASAVEPVTTGLSLLHAKRTEHARVAETATQAIVVLK
jgi:hypothetical protein